jgi:hypothetical protein
VPGNVRSMSRGVVLWPDDDTSRVVTNLWALLEAEGVPTLATHTHRQHRPHVSLVVADDLLPSEALDVLESVPLKTLHLLVSGPGIFPGGILFLACVPNAELLEEQRRVHDLVAPMTKALWDYFAPGAWSPHLTISYGLDGVQLARAIPVVLDQVPVEGWLERGGVEDGISGERWLASGPRSGLPAD